MCTLKNFPLESLRRLISASNQSSVLVKVHQRRESFTSIPGKMLKNFLITSASKNTLVNLIALSLYNKESIVCI